MHPDFPVRVARAEDLAQLCAFQVAMAWESEGMTLDPGTMQRGVQHVLQGSEPGLYYVITDNDLVVGCALVQYEWSDWRAKRVLWLHSVYVRPEYRRKGCFRTLYGYLQDEVRRNPELAGIRLYVDKKNTQAEDCYRGLGMTDEHYKLFEWLKSED
jgi:ribosomal protein S18 acetylase RimI-like enzyme